MKKGNIILIIVLILVFASIAYYIYAKNKATKEEIRKTQIQSLLGSELSAEESTNKQIDWGKVVSLIALL